MSTFKHRFLTGSVYSFSGMIFVQIFSVGLSVVLARLLGPHDLGILTILGKIGLVVVPLTIFGINVALTKYIAEYKIKDKGSLSRLLPTATMLVLCFSIVVSIIYFLLSDTIAIKIYNMPVIGFFIKISAIFLTLNGLVYIGTATLQGFQRIKTLSVLNVLMNALNLPIYFIFIWEMGLLGAVIAGVVSIVINLIITSKCVKNTLQQENVKLNIVFDRKIRGVLLKFSFPLFLSILVLRPADLFAISYLSVATGFESAGFYRIAAGLSRLILFIPAALTIPLLPMFSELYASNMDKQNIVSRIIKLVILICLPISLAIGLGARYIISLLYGQEYVGAALLTYILCISAFIDSIAIVIVSLLHGTGRTWHGLGIDIFQAILIVFGSYYFIGIYGLIGIGYANLLKISLLIIILIFYMNKKSELNIKLLELPLILAVLFITSSFFVIKYVQIVYVILFFIVIILIEMLTLSTSDKELIRKTFK